MKTSMTADPRVIRDLLARQYAQPPLLIVVRELLQNAVDAGGEAPISLVVEAQKPGVFQIVCRDYGTGMSQEDVMNNLLVLGRSGKSNSSIGGFGVAGAVILGYNTRIRTRDLEIVSSDGEITIAPSEEWIQGTEVTVQGVPADPLGIRLTTLMVALSRVTATVRIDGWEADLPLPLSTIVRIGEGEEGRTRWEAHLVHPLRVTGSTDTITSAGVIVYRMGGLVQMVDDWQARSHPDTIVVDITTSARPGDEDYPLGLSREDLRGNIRTQINAALLPHIQNPLTSHQRGTSPPLPDVVEWEGRWISTGDNPPADPERICLSQRGKALSPIGIRCAVRRHYPPSGTEWRILDAWAKVVEIVARHVGPLRFSVGVLPTEDPTYASLESAGGQAFTFMLNVGRMELLSPSALPHVLFHLACHEAAHVEYPYHGEHHSARMAQLAMQAAGDFEKHSGAIRNALSGRKGPGAPKRAKASRSLLSQPRLL